LVRLKAADLQNCDLGAEELRELRLYIDSAPKLRNPRIADDWRFNDFGGHLLSRESSGVRRK